METAQLIRKVGVLWDEITSILWRRSIVLMVQNIIIETTRETQCQYENNLETYLVLHRKHFIVMRERKKGCPKVCPFQEANGSLISDKYRMSEVFADAFASVVVTSHPNSPHDHQKSEFGK